jgi:hypothetical protein
MTQPRASMTRRLALVAGGAFGAGMVWAPPALAHRAQTVLSTVTWNSASSTLDVMHRLHGHDAEVCLAMKSGAPQADITELRTQAQLMIYIEETFALTDGGRAIALSPLGAEMQGEAVLLYQECKLTAPPQNLAIDNRILRDVFENQTNLVNVKLAQRTRTLLFSGGDGFKKAEGLL